MRLNLLIKIDRFPVFDSSWFALAEVGPHWEGGNREFKRIFVVFSHALDEECADIVHRPPAVKVGGRRLGK
jgi:hypothetical protein